MRLALVRRRVEEILDLTQLAVAPDERRLEATDLSDAPRGEDAVRPPELIGSSLPFSSMGTRRLVGDGVLGTRGGWRPRRGQCRARRPTGPARRVDDVAGDHPLALGAKRDRRLASEHSGTRCESFAPSSRPSAETAATRSSGPNGALGVVLGRHGVPQTAITASPMNFSTMPPYSSISVSRSRSSARGARASPRRRATPIGA